MVNDDPPFSDAIYFPNEDDTSRVPCISNRQKKLNQWNRWSTEVIPSLVPLWRAYLHKTSNLRIPALPKNTEGSECFCDSGGRLLHVTCILFDRVEQIILCTCACASAPSQLMAMGLFGCALITPSLTVDLRLLQFVKTLFERGYGLTTQDNLRRRFSNTYHWYIVLVMHNKELVSGIINASSSHHEHETSDSKEEEGGAHEDAKDPQQLQYPSDYLRSHCPLCFGGPSETVTQMEVHVEHCQSKGKECGWRVLRPSEDEDRVEEGMRVPALVLDGCGESFVAADEKREKASTHFFADMGLMALLCWHDCVLWLVNMTSTGEKQHYALALIQQLTQHIPDNMRVGLLYDIGCQLERSWRKFKFFANSILSRFHFAISVFHAYGHQWPCQVVYHPRKRQGFGLSDGEGCERLWSALKPLIGPLRVSGYHQCLFVLDLQVHHLDVKSCLGYGDQSPRVVWYIGEDIVVRVGGSGGDSDQASTQWQSKHKADAEIPKIFELEKLVGARAQMVLSLELQFISNQVYNVESFEIEIADACSQHNNLLEMLRRQREGVGVTGHAKLAALRGNVFLQVHMNALAVKTRIRDRLRQRKFELERIEWAYCQTVGGYVLMQRHHVRVRVNPGVPEQT
ncbi:hypothetical protein PAXINDRAFT_14434 [Paxillus involutus ATCC 200175]|uniref:CxC1-like cysteine cluster associated with KDZ transposases domain-containing protein n=1 Tax=Paxillus involutus ATCC 200175 TaxID=664439 RepID=A0A0C9TYT0_PAXIN|nr:hypothetical protein PAXINDRAFT_14434 [Paxillus involutus ATCC 200175]